MIAFEAWYKIAKIGEEFMKYAENSMLIFALELIKDWVTKPVE
jgi:hypothetical protein